MHVYFIRAGKRGAIKIGVARNIGKRLAELQTANAYELHLIASIECDGMPSALRLEKQLHKRFKRQCIRGEWFQGNIEFRRIKEPIIDTDTTKSKLNPEPLEEWRG